MESKAVKGVHVLGDATLSAPAMPKSASMANNHAEDRRRRDRRSAQRTRAAAAEDHQHLLQLRLGEGSDQGVFSARMGAGPRSAHRGERIRRRLGRTQRGGGQLRLELGAHDLGRFSRLSACILLPARRKSLCAGALRPPRWREPVARSKTRAPRGKKRMGSRIWQERRWTSD